MRDKILYSIREWIQKLDLRTHSVKDIVEKVRNYPDSYIIICFLCFFSLDYIGRFQFAEYGILNMYDNITFFFVISWCFIFSFIIYLLPGKSKKIVFLFLIIFLIIYTCGQSVFYFLFKKFFSITDISLAQEGIDFIDTSYFQIHPMQISYSICILLVAIMNCFLMPLKQKNRWQVFVGMAIGSLISFMSAFHNFPPMENPSLWAASKAPANVYANFTNTTFSYLMCGTYQYIFRDVYLYLVPVEMLSNTKLINRLNSYYEDKEDVHIPNEMTGKFAGNNIILLQLENIDTWMLNETATPALSYMKQNGIDFINHYSASFSTGRTFNTEFIVNTGLIPPTKGEAPSYIFSRNIYPFAMGNIFKKAGYSVESFHPNGGSAYNRNAAHRNFGYTKYHDWEDMNMKNWTMDSEMINGFEDMVRTAPYMDFIITISGHSPFDFEAQACVANYDEVVLTSLYDDEEYICAQAQAKETDKFVEKLLKQLYEIGELENTTFVVYTDHFAYGTLSDEFYEELKGTSEGNLLQRTPFFIWSMESEPEIVEKVTSSIDVLPTLTNLFGIPTQYQFYIGSDAFNEDGDYVYFEDGALYNGDVYYHPAQSEEPQHGIEEKLQESVNKLQISWDILISNYFSTIEASE